MKPTSLIPAFILAVAGLPAANDDPTLKNTLVGNVAFSGSGCPNGTAVTTIQNNAATIAFSKLKTELAKDLKTTTVSLDCGAIFHVNVPTGWKFRPYKGDTRLYVQVDKGIYGIVRTAYSVAKSSNATLDVATFIGPVNGTALKSDRFQAPYSTCGGAVDFIHQSLLILSSNNTNVDHVTNSYMTVDSVDVGVEWAKC